MKASRFNEEQIIAILREQEAGAKTADVCRKHGISGATFYKWKAKYGGLDVSDARRLKALEDENRRLKKLLAEAMLDHAMLILLRREGMHMNHKKLRRIPPLPGGIHLNSAANLSKQVGPAHCLYISVPSLAAANGVPIRYTKDRGYSTCGLSASRGLKPQAVVQCSEGPSRLIRVIDRLQIAHLT